MGQYKGRHHASSSATLVWALRRSPALRSIVYLTGAAATLRTISSIYDRETYLLALTATHLTTLPFVTAWTYTFVALREEDLARWNRVPLRQGITQAGFGMVLGAGAFLAVVSTAAAYRWVHLPIWGWERSSKAAVAHTLLLLAAGHLAVAWNEEMVFRGYGLDTVSAAISRPTAILGLTALFARAHGTELHVLVGQGAIGLALMGLRLRTDSLWLPVGYHFAWNYLQTAIFGPPDVLPSLRPLYVTGPELWLGRPGHPEPGLFSTIVHLGVAVIAAWGWWRHRHRR